MSDLKLSRADVTWLEEVGVDDGLMLIAKQDVFVVPVTPLSPNLPPTPEAEQHGVKNNNTQVSTILCIMSKALQPLLSSLKLYPLASVTWNLGFGVSALLFWLYKISFVTHVWVGWYNFHGDTAGLSRNVLPKAMARSSGIAVSSRQLLPLLRHKKHWQDLNLIHCSVVFAVWSRANLYHGKSWHFKALTW